MLENLKLCAVNASVTFLVVGSVPKILGEGAKSRRIVQLFQSVSQHACFTLHLLANRHLGGVCIRQYNSVDVAPMTTAASSRNEIVSFVCIRSVIGSTLHPCPTGPPWTIGDS